MQLAWGYAPPLIIEAAVEHGVFDHLEKRPLTLEELAAATGASTRGLKAILDALVALQFLSRSGERYALTPESAAFLVSSKPSFYGGFFRHISTQLLPQWLQITDVVRTGRPALSVNERGRGAEFFAQGEGFIEPPRKGSQLLQPWR